MMNKFLYILVIAFLYCCNGGEQGFNPDKDAHARIEIIYHDDRFDTSGNNYALNEIMVFTKNDAILKEVVRRTKIEHLTTEDLRAHLDIENVKETNILRIRFYTEAKELGVMILDTLVNELRKFEIAEEFEKNDIKIRKYQEGLDSINHLIDSLGRKLEAFSPPSSQIINLNEERETESESLAQTYFAIDRALKSITNAEIPEWDKYLSKDEFLQKALADYEKAYKSCGLTGNADDCKKRDMWRNNLVQYLTNSKKAYEAQIQELKKKRRHFTEMENREQGEKDWSEQYKKAEMLYGFYLEKLASAQIHRAGIISNIRIISRGEFYKNGKQVN